MKRKQTIIIPAYKPSIGLIDLARNLAFLRGISLVVWDKNIRHADGTKRNTTFLFAYRLCDKGRKI